MKAWQKVTRYELRDVARTRAVVGYGLFFLASTWGLLRLGGGVERVLPSLVNVTLLTVPLVSVVVSTVFLYESRAFTALLLSQPVGRDDLFRGLYLGLTLPLIGAFLLGAGVPLLGAGAATIAPSATLAVLFGGVLLTAAFSALGFLVAFSIREPSRGLVGALLVWLGLTLVYDGLVLGASHALAAYPLERPMLAAMLGNPVDLARLIMLMAVDASVLLGYTGAVFQDFFGSAVGFTVAAGSLLAWIVLPYRLARGRFRRMDF